MLAELDAFTSAGLLKKRVLSNPVDPLTLALSGYLAASFVHNCRIMTPKELKDRTFAAAVRTIRFLEGLPREPRTSVVGRQLLRSGTSTAAQYRAACRAQSTRDFISKMKRMEEEADESTLWLGLLRATGLSQRLTKEAAALEDEFSQFTAIAVSSAKSARQRLRHKRRASRPRDTS